jgi:nucleotide-binding universal stress UspA family protein
MKTIVALVDFSDVTSRLLEQVTKIALPFDARVTLLHVVPEEPAVVELGLASPTILQAPSQRKIEAHYERLTELRNSLTNSGVKAFAQQVEEGGVEKVIEICQTLEADLIVVGSHHHSAFYNLIVGTFTGDVLKRARCPVLVVPAESSKRG